MDVLSQQGSSPQSGRSWERQWSTQMFPGMCWKIPTSVYRVYRILCSPAFLLNNFLVLSAQQTSVQQGWTRTTPERKGAAKIMQTSRGIGADYGGLSASMRKYSPDLSSHTRKLFLIPATPGQAQGREDAKPDTYLVTSGTSEKLRTI